MDCVMGGPERVGEWMEAGDEWVVATEGICC